MLTHSVKKTFFLILFINIANTSFGSKSDNNDNQMPTDNQTFKIISIRRPDPASASLQQSATSQNAYAFPILTRDDYTKSSDDCSLTGAVINGNANLTATQHATLARCSIFKDLNLTAPTCELDGTNIKGACSLQGCLTLYMRNRSKITGDLTFHESGPAGKVIMYRECIIDGRVYNGTIETITNPNAESTLS